MNLYLIYPFLHGALAYVGTAQNASRALLVASIAYGAQLCLAGYLLATPDDPLAGEQPFLYNRAIFGMRVCFYMNQLTRLPLFVMGICCAHMVQSLSSEGPWPARLAVIADASTGTFVALIALNYLLRQADAEGVLWGAFASKGIFLRLTMYSPLLFAMMLGLAVGPGSIAQRVLTQPVIMLLGKWSYGVYLYGQPVPPGPLDVAVASYAKTVVLGGVSFTLVEEPAQKFAAWLTTASSPKSSPQASLLDVGPQDDSSSSDSDEATMKQS